MRKNSKTKIMIVLLIGLNLCCAFFHQTQKKEGNIRKEIIKGVTSEAMVLNSLGMPNLVSTNNIGDEVWNYRSISYSTTKSSNENMLVLWELTTGDSTEMTKPFNLLITFDQTDIVKDFEVVFTSF